MATGHRGTFPAGTVAVLQTQLTFTSGQIFVNSPFFGSGGFTIPSGGVTAASTGAEVTINASTGLVTAINSGTIIAGPVTTTPYFLPVASSPSALGAAPAAAPVISAPGLAGTAAIQPQLNVDALMDALSAAAE